MKSTTNTRVFQNDIFKRLNSILGDLKFVWSISALIVYVITFTGN